jgi:hypothetical protein
MKVCIIVGRIFVMSGIIIVENEINHKSIINEKNQEIIN